MIFEPLNTVEQNPHLRIADTQISKLDFCVSVKPMIEYIENVTTEEEAKLALEKLNTFFISMTKGLFLENKFLREFKELNSLPFYYDRECIEKYKEEARNGKLFSSLLIKPCRIYGQKKKRLDINNDSEMGINNIYFYFTNKHEKVSPVHLKNVVKMILYLTVCEILKDVPIYSHESFFSCINPIIVGCTIEGAIKLKDRCYSDYVLGLYQLVPLQVDNKMAITKNEDKQCISFKYQNDEADFMYPDFDDVPIKDEWANNFRRFHENMWNCKYIETSTSSSYIDLRLFKGTEKISFCLKLKGLNIMQELPDVYYRDDIPHSLEEDKNIVLMFSRVFRTLLEHTAQCRFYYENGKRIDDDFNSLVLSDKMAIIQYLQEKYDIKRGLCHRTIKALELSWLPDVKIKEYIDKRYNSTTDSHQRQELTGMINDIKDYRKKHPPINPVKELYEYLCYIW